MGSGLLALVGSWVVVQCSRLNCGVYWMD
ncbi:hypothetical protein Goarm_023101 [Gossypium armourianum]|uniref:Uncharacterized protein n=1 Tax=Gossypium armourianum TaxID=34283 RepID=A0A7J9KHJ7_9ROSI|nr:hypothetical protein [Gossypium armourianum]